MRNKLILSLAGGAFCFAGPAFAGPPTPPPAPVYNWTGWYAGANAGASFGDVKTDFNVAPVRGMGLVGSVIVPGVGLSDGRAPKRIHGRRSDWLQLAVFPPNCRRA